MLEKNRANAHLSSRLIGGLACVLVSLSAAGDLNALGREQPNFSLGLSGAVDFDELRGAGAAVGIDASLLFGEAFWTTVGGRISIARAGERTLAYAEAGCWFFGLGYSHAVFGDLASRSHAHAFVGFPYELFGVSVPEPMVGLYLEPYYRPMVSLRRGRQHWSHEIGILVKATTLKWGSWRPKHNETVAH